MDYSHDSIPNIPYEDRWVSLYIIPKNTQISLRITDGYSSQYIKHPQ